MNYIDIIIVLAIAIGAIYGVIRGLICQLGSLSGFILGIILSRVFGEELSSTLVSQFDMPQSVGDVVAHILIFVVVYIACVLLVKLIHKLVRWVAMGWIDRLAGMLFGAVKWVFALSLLFNLILLVDLPGKLLPKEDLASSKYYEFTLRFAPTAFSIAQERWFDETKGEADLFIPCVDVELFCRENCKAD